MSIDDQPISFLAVNNCGEDGCCVGGNGEGKKQEGSGKFLSKHAQNYIPALHLCKQVLREFSQLLAGSPQGAFEGIDGRLAHTGCGQRDG